ncbi:hypothetical protein [Lewinella cohaerens]|uniref:hypothetical protein n=1 Tax=Lewinella cohaerens TaxID=70995 RepID=UPI000362EA6F|nr:hypothetical protein [Lewinella cohaerens]
MTIQNARLVRILMSIPLLLLIPFIAMQFSGEVHWGLLDFVVAGFLLLTAGLAVELVLRRVTQRRHRALLLLAILAVFLLVWAELAVGLFGTVLAGS